MKQLLSRLDALPHSLSRIPKWVGEYPLFGFFFLLLVAVLVSFTVFYWYAFLDSDRESAVRQDRFDARAFQRLVQTWEELNAKFANADTVRWRDMFARAQAE